MITQAIISAGGYGTRLRPYTDKVPKPMIPILGYPMLLWNILQFKKYGVREFFLTLHYLPGVVREFFGDGSRFGVKIVYHIEDEPMGSVGGIKAFTDQLGERFFYLYGDIFSQVDYGAMEEAFLKKKDAIGMQRVQKSDFHTDADLAEINGEGKCIAVHPKPHAESFENAYRMRGIFILTKEVIEMIPANEPYDMGKDMLPLILRNGKSFYGYECDEYSKGVDTIEKWKEVEKLLQEKNSSLPGV